MLAMHNVPFFVPGNKMCLHRTDLHLIREFSASKHANEFLHCGPREGREVKTKREEINLLVLNHLKWLLS